MPPGPDEPAFYAELGDLQGDSYARNAFVRGTDEEVGALTRHLELGPGRRLLDVGCGDGRHLRALARRGVTGVGVDVSSGLVAAARRAAEAEGAGGLVFEVGDARRLAGVAAIAEAGPFDAGTALCHGAFGTHPATDPAVLAQLVRAVRPGGRVAVTAFSALFAARHLVDGDRFDPVHLVHHQVSEVHGADGVRRSFDLWTVAYTVPHLVRLAEDAGLEVVTVVGCEPGRYGGEGVALDDPELLLVGVRR